VAACALSIRDHLIAPTANYETPDPNCDLDFVPFRARKANVNCALVNVRGLGGSAGGALRLGCARGTALSTASALPANWTRIAPALTAPGRQLRTVTSAATTLATSSSTSGGSSSGWVPWFVNSKSRSSSRMAGPAEQYGARPQHRSPHHDLGRCALDPCRSSGTNRRRFRRSSRTRFNPSRH